MARFWKITGYNSDEIEFECRVPEGALSETAMIALLQRLAARHLEADEVVSSSLRRNASGYTSHLEVRRNADGSPSLMTTGTGHYYMATIQEGD